ncbi:unnamed protein product [Rotaria sordida]|uniref:Uncharacterized protein n=1 Tax=Rotaria sordida TaxID=392033 RepID=A0A818U9V6_9BILA|nr:unnamed protein product [Rotaria sordida]
MMNTRKVAPTDYYERHTMPRKIIEKRPARPKTISSKGFASSFEYGTSEACVKQLTTVTSTANTTTGSATTAVNANTTSAPTTVSAATTSVSTTVSAATTSASTTVSTSGAGE